MWGEIGGTIGGIVRYRGNRDWKKSGAIGGIWEKIGGMLGKSGEWWVVDRARVNAIDPYGIFLRCDRLTNHTLLAGPTIVHCQPTGICCVRNPIGNTIVRFG